MEGLVAFLITTEGGFGYDFPVFVTKECDVVVTFRDVDAEAEFDVGVIIDHGYIGVGLTPKKKPCGKQAT